MNRVWPVTNEMIVKAVAEATPWVWVEPTENSVGAYWCALCRQSYCTDDEIEQPENHEDNCPWRLAKEACDAL